MKNKEITKKNLFANSKNGGFITNAFTLIELLAIIVILAIIAVITVPIILNIIDNSKKGTAIDSAYGYRDAIQKFYMSKMLEDNTYAIENGEHDILYYVNEGLSVNGDVPTDGWILIENQNITDFSIKIGDYAVTYTYSSNSVNAVKGGEIVLTPTQQAKKDAKDKALAYVNSFKTAKGNVSNIYSVPDNDVSNSDVTNGWVALLNGEVIGYSLQVGNYVVTLVSTVSAEETNEIASNQSALTQIKEYYGSLAIDSVSDYIESVTTKSNTKNYDEDKSFTVDEIITELSETKPSEFDNDSWVYFSYDSNAQAGSKMSVTNYSFKVTEGDFTFIIEIDNSGNPYITENTALSNKVAALSSEFLNNIVSYDTVEIVYYNPVGGVMNCTGYVSNNSKPGFDGVISGDNSTKTETDQTSCLKWYKYSTNIDGTVNMILDHNTSLGVKYYTSQENTYGPSNLMQYLTFSGWQGVPARNDKYIAYVDNGTTKTAKFTNATGNAVNYSGKKARLISAQEIAEITGAASRISWNEQSTSSSYYYFGSLSSTTYSSQNATQKARQESFYWLFENLYNCGSYGCSTTGDNAHTQPGNNVETGNYGYWTSSPRAGGSDTAWFVYTSGILRDSRVNDTSIGVRPVITVSNS